MRRILAILAALALALPAGRPALAAAGPPVLTGSNDPAQVDAATGLHSGIRRIYENAPPASLRQDGMVRKTLAAGLDVVVSFRPAIPALAGQVADFTSWCQSVAAAGDQSRVFATVWHEPNLHTGLTSWLAEYAAFQPAAEASGIAFGMIAGTYYFNHGTSLDAWMPPAATVSFLGVDLYPRPKRGFGDPLAQLRNFTAWTSANGVPLDIAETGIEPRWYGTKTENAAARAYLLGLENLPASTQWVMWFQGTGIDLAGHHSALVPAWKAVIGNLGAR